VHCESRVVVAVARGQFGNPEGGERPPLEAGTRGLVKDSRPRRLSACIVNCRLCELAISVRVKCDHEF
jgi:hypothetical protein